jgi:ergothioneine biosynthesis protein EgtB
MLHRLPYEEKRSPRDYAPRVEGRSPAEEWTEIPGGRATLGADRADLEFCWDNESPRNVAEVAPFAVQRHNVTNAAFLEFVASGGYRDERWWTADDWAWIREARVEHPLFWESDGSGWRWRGMFERLPLPGAWPVYVSHAEASAYARWRGARLMSEAEFQRAAFGTPEESERGQPWGDGAPSAAHGVFDFASWDPAPVGSHPSGRSAWGVDDLVGNGWEWTATPFAPFPGFEPIPAYPEYSVEFFDGRHFVMKGASPATARELIRPTFRNWFRGHYPYVYAGFRCARTAA